MNFLIDTHVFIWLDIAQNRLSTTVQQAIQDPQNTLYLSLASIWEMQIKIQLGKLHLNASLATTLITQQQTNLLQLLPIDLRHILALNHLSPHHSDPFDRLIIAQSQIEELTIITNDREIQKYPVRHLW